MSGVFMTNLKRCAVDINIESIAVIQPVGIEPEIRGGPQFFQFFNFYGGDVSMHIVFMALPLPTPPPPLSFFFCFQSGGVFVFALAFMVLRRDNTHPTYSMVERFRSSYPLWIRTRIPSAAFILGVLYLSNLRGFGWG